MRLFLLRTARRLGFPTVRHLVGSGITAAEVMELAALEVLDPPTGQRVDAGFAALMSLVYNRTRGKRERARKPAEFLPRWGPADPQEAVDKMRSTFDLIRMARNG